MNQPDFLGKALVSKWQFDELLDDFRRITIRMEKLIIEYSLLKAKHLEVIDYINRQGEGL